MKKYYLPLALLALPALALANTGAPDPLFVAYYQTVLSFATGPLGVGLATTLLVMGGAIGVAKGSPMPTLVGVMGAMFLHFGPSIIANMSGVDPQALAPSQTAQVVADANPKAAKAARAASVSTPSAQSIPASSVAVATAASAAQASVATIAPAMPAPAPHIAASTVAAPASSSALTSHTASLAHTVPVPTATPVHTTIKAPSVSSSQLTKWVGLGGAAIILTLLGLLGFLSAQRRARSAAGFTPGGSSTPAPTSVFQDPHGFQREKRSLTFGPEST